MKTDEKNKTSNQVKRKAPNPTGKGGFQDNPQNRSDGRWSKENSYSYWLNKFKSLSISEFETYTSVRSKDDMSIAEITAHEMIKKSLKKLPEFKEVADRTEGKVQSTVDVTSNGETVLGNAITFTNYGAED